jgi:hypothetical protein
MRSDDLFLRRTEQIAALSQAHDEGSLIDLSGHLYQMLCDKHSLVDTVSKGCVQASFSVNARAREPLPDWLVPLVHYQAAEDLIDPELWPGVEVAPLSKDDFLKMNVMYIRGQYLTVKHVIGFARNVAGGGHFDPTPQYGPYEALRLWREAPLIHPMAEGYHPGLRQLRSVARVTLRALQPLVETVRLRLGHGPIDAFDITP